MELDKWQLCASAVVGALIGVETFGFVTFYLMQFRMDNSLATATFAIASALAGSVIAAAVAVARNLLADLMQGRD